MLNKLFSALLIAIIRIYQLTFSAFFGRSCRFLPTCSHYTSDAIKAHGAWAGLWMGIARFWRCRPGVTHGFDPVPEKAPDNAKWWKPWRYGSWTSDNLDA